MRGVCIGIFICLFFVVSHTSSSESISAIASHSSLSNRFLAHSIDGTLTLFDASKSEIISHVSLEEPTVEMKITGGEEDSFPLVVPSVTGTLFVYIPGRGLQKSQMTVDELSKKSPFLTRDGTLFLSNRISDIFFFESEGNEIPVGLTKYEVTAFDTLSKKDVWKFSYIEAVPPEREEEGKNDDENPPIVALSTVNGRIRFFSEKNDLWDIHLPSPVVSLFRVNEDLTLQKVQLSVLVSVPHNTQKELEKRLSSSKGKDVVLVSELDGRLIIFDSLMALPSGTSDSSDQIHSSEVVHRNEGEDCLIIDVPNIFPTKGTTGLHFVDVVPRDDICPSDEYSDEESNNVIVISLLIIVVLLAISSLSIVIWIKKRNRVSVSGDKIKTKRRRKKKMKEVKVNETIGGIEMSKNVLGVGSHGTVVYEGSWQGRRVAVKRMVKEFYNIAEKEIQILIESDSHPNIVRYFARVEDDKFVYLALERCKCSLGQFVEEERRKNENGKFVFTEELRTLLRDAAQGMGYLHNNGIVHRDMKPQNILVSIDGVAKISDMGLAKVLEADQSSFATAGVGTVGWQAPELAAVGSNEEKTKRMTLGVDIFSFGCVIFFVVSGGLHPFGDHTERSVNMVRGEPKLSALARDAVAYRLVSRCISHSPTNRPTSTELICDPFFWDPLRILEFYQDVSDEISRQRDSSPLYSELETKSAKIFRGRESWDAFLDREVYRNATSFKRYDITLVRELIRCIRNMTVHHREYEEGAKAILLPPQGIALYFCKCFPILLLEVYEMVEKHWKHLPVMEKYYP